MTRSLTSKLAQAFTRDFPNLDLVLWHEHDSHSLQRCFEGCYGIFITSGLLTSPTIESTDLVGNEIALGKKFIEAAETAKIRHLIYPTFPSIFNASEGRINIRHFETKYQIFLHIKSSSTPSTILCPGPFYTDLNTPQYTYRDKDTVIFSTPAAPEKTMGWSDPGHDIGWFTRAAFNKGPEWMQGQEIPVCGQCISYTDLASKFTAVAGIKAEYRQCSIEEFEARSRQAVTSTGQNMRALGEWLAIAPDQRTCYGTIEMERLKIAEEELGVKALTWEMFLMRTGWRGPPK